MEEYSRFNEYLTKEIQYLQRTEIELADHIASMPEGSLNIGIKRGKPQHYLYRSGQKRKYLSQKNQKLIEQLAQKRYETDVLDMIRERLEFAELLKMKYDHPLSNCYNSLSDSRKILVKPYPINDQDYIENWYKKHPAMQNTIEYSNTYYTNKEEAVRSKSEKIIADMLYRYRIPYIYEPRIYINGRRYIPDFLILNPRTREEYIYEHFGMMDDSNYAMDNIAKMNYYFMNGYEFGKNFVYTMETKKSPLDVHMVEKIIKTYFL